MNKDINISKRLALWLRHNPAAGGLTLDEQGWADVETVLAALKRAGLPNNLSRPLEVIETNDKQRFELSEDRSRIRARQGHSVEVELDWPSVPPPEHLYHGTVERLLPTILSEGLKPMWRHHVHLSTDVATARRVGGRHGAPVVLVVRAAALADTGVPFLLTANQVWLADAVPPEFLSLLDA